MSYPATQLFADRAAAVRPSFVIDEATVGPVVEIVRRLDGLPLAIELAAARLRTMPVEQIAARLTDRFRLLTGGSRTALPRHRTLLAVVEWSWDLLSDDERRLARRLAVFVGGITVSSAAGGLRRALSCPRTRSRTCSARWSTSRCCSSSPTQGRYRMLETLREFGLERMAEVGEVSTVRAAHARHFAALAEHADPHAAHPRSADLAARSSTPSATTSSPRCASSPTTARPRPRSDVAIAMNWYWVLMGRHGEAAAWTGFALAAPGEVDPTVAGRRPRRLLAINSAASLWAGEPAEMQAQADGDGRGQPPNSTPIAIGR